MDVSSRRLEDDHLPRLESLRVVEMLPRCLKHVENPKMVGIYSKIQNVKMNKVQALKKTTCSM